MGGRFGRDAGTALFGAADDTDGVAGRNMLEVDVGASGLREDHVAGDDDVFGGVRPAAEPKSRGDFALVHDGTLRERGVLTVIHDREVEHRRVFARATHEFVGLDAIAVVGNGDDAHAFERADGCEGLTLHAHGDAAGGEDFDDGVTADSVVDELDGAGVVGDGGRVGHAHDGGEAAGGGGARAGADGLLVRLAGFAEVDVDIDEAGAGDEPVGVDFFRAFFLRGGERRDEFSVDGEEVAAGVAFGGGVDDAGVLDPEVRHGREVFLDLRSRGRRCRGKTKANDEEER